MPAHARELTCGQRGKGQQLARLKPSKVQTKPLPGSTSTGCAFVTKWSLTAGRILLCRDFVTTVKCGATTVGFPTDGSAREEGERLAVEVRMATPRITRYPERLYQQKCLLVLEGAELERPSPTYLPTTSFRCFATASAVLCSPFFASYL